ncbi:Inner membrane protein yehU [Fibrella aestuarina BUZ 2]|uniref:Inner membrane protein yehU n=1 Tax=Fibrella aestuarina BUZ 2 TaxID=1166018 RepID=I0K7E1_9BACT|nr:sensor histidine kinase [Fibrella aestuarina]CCH00044.1 Inner membrane protein yehU [Fibrella aestuarina BUZ 2]
MPNQSVRARFWALLQGAWRWLSARPWLRRALLWGLCYYYVRYVYYGEFFQASARTLDVLALVLQAQTMLIYYVFGYVIFPRTLYKGKILEFVGTLFVTHALIYQTNYWLFYGLAKTGEPGRLQRLWALVETWGLWGWINNGTAASWSFFWTFTVVIFLLAVRAVIDIIRLRTHVIQLEKDKLQLELDFLKSQVNPHFLFNTLNSVYARVFDTDESAADLLLRLSELMRYNLYETNQPRVALTSELAYIQNYLDLERNRLEGQPVEITYAQTGEATTHTIAPLLLIAFVENAFKHGVKGATKPAFVRVAVQVAGGQLLFTVENSVFPKRQSVSPDPVKQSGGIGLDNVRRRLQTLYPNRHSLTVTPGDASYQAQVTLEL